MAFNEQYTKYLGQYVYGTEVLTLQNKHYNNDKVEVIVKGEQPQITDSRYNVVTSTNTVGYTNFLVENNIKYYKCTQIGYDDATGKVNSITFEQIRMSSMVE